MRTIECTADRPPPRNPLEEAVEWTRLTRWRGLRSERVAAGLAYDWCDWLAAREVACLDDVNSSHLAEYLDARRAAGDVPATLQKRYYVLKAVFEEAQRRDPPLASKGIPRIRTPKIPKVDKWWLPPDQLAAVLAKLRALDDFLADYIEFVGETGVRVEEALRIRCRHFSGLGTATPSLSVPGTKSKSAVRHVPISVGAADIALRRLGVGADSDDLLFPMKYVTLKQRWTKRRKELGFGKAEGATLRAFRRSFAGKTYKNGMPTEMLRRLLGHSDIATTAEYLRLTGVYDIEQARTFLDAR